MSRDVSTIWKNPPGDMLERLDARLGRVLAQGTNPGDKVFFFRADDIAEVCEDFSKLIALFAKHRAPLALAAVPGWLTVEKWTDIQNLTSAAPSLWCWHQHGWSHADHSIQGKKCEFGDDRTPEDIEDDLARGRRRLETIMGDSFSPVFTPPWNRCGQIALDTLKKLGFKAVSRSQGAAPPAPSGLAQCDINVDLHTRKDADPEKSLEALLGEIESGLVEGFCGIMIHHRRMNDAAFAFLDRLLQNLRRCPDVNMLRLDDPSVASARPTNTETVPEP